MAELENNEKKKNNNRIMLSYIIVVLALGLVAVGVIYSAFHTAFVEKEKWQKVAETQKRPDLVIHPGRGNIYSSDFKLMATSVPHYNLYFDFRADGFLTDTFLHSKRNGIDSLSYYLSKKLKNRTQAGYKAHLMKGLKGKSRQFAIYEGRVSYADLKEIRKFPFLRLNRYKSGFYTKEMVQREKPFGSLASRTIGDIYGELEKEGISKGKNGIELQYDSLLRGKPGVSSRRRVGGGWTNWTEIEPDDGMDIRTTIDIKIQDITEKSLVDMLKSIDAESGTAVVMEVETGEIKAITNMGRVRTGEYRETMNYAVADQSEPGSTFKVVSMMVALEDGICEPTDSVDTGDGLFIYKGARMTDHNRHKGGYHWQTAEKAIWNSSNIGVAKFILKGYENNPGKFIEGLERTGINADLDLGIPGSGKAKLRKPGDKGWSKTSLPWISFGYETQIPPIYTLTFYNAIANEGKMVHPLFTKEILKNGKVHERFSTKVVKSSICSDRTLKIIQSMLEGVVLYGTARQMKSDVISIAGKTGTAQLASQGVYRTSGHQVSFCGYFPSEKPQYSCIVVIRRPKGVPSGGGMAGMVVKHIAEKIFASQQIYDLAKMEKDSTAVLYPEVKSGDQESILYVLDKLNIKSDDDSLTTQWAQAKADIEANRMTLKDVKIQEGLVPRVIGMGAKDAVFLMEKTGLHASISGTGRVVSQSIPPGQRVTKGKTVSLTLR
ncbi:transpeptidase family protein [Parabacteroides sp. OttesenSCG-928-N08]|nr:transpeptidase family protein [Parabacteroides sp. OttesenSCG-928-N08]